MSLDLKTLIKEAYQTACEKGWHDTKRDFEDVICLIHTELSETYEEYRNHHELSEIYYSGTIGDKPFVFPKSIPGVFEKPEGIPVELADVCIRIFDTFGAFNADVDELTPRYIGRTINSLAGLINNCHMALNKALVARYPAGWLLGVVFEIEEFCNCKGIELGKAIELKMNYNRGRSWRHNGKRV
jgi:hypothetical protein